MSWGTNNPKETGWYLCTVQDSFGRRFVMPLQRGEYPKNNFTWYGLTGDEKVVASQKFPKKYEGDEND